jgi:hypothetical protein
MNEGLSNFQIHTIISATRALYLPNPHATLLLFQRNGPWYKYIKEIQYFNSKFTIAFVSNYMCRSHCYIIRSYIPITEQIITYIHI